MAEGTLAYKGGTEHMGFVTKGQKDIMKDELKVNKEVVWRRLR